jgi:hypothetical protein
VCVFQSCNMITIAKPLHYQICLLASLSCALRKVISFSKLNVTFEQWWFEWSPHRLVVLHLTWSRSTQIPTIQKLCFYFFDRVQEFGHASTLFHFNAMNFFWKMKQWSYIIGCFASIIILGNSQPSCMDHWIVFQYQASHFLLIWQEWKETLFFIFNQFSIIYTPLTMTMKVVDNPCRNNLDLEIFSI